MDVRRIIAEIDAEIEKLQGVRANLAGLSNGITGVVTTTGRRGRPKGSKNAPKPATEAAKTATKKTAKRRLSPEGRKAIADAMKRRWAERRKQVAGK